MKVMDEEINTFDSKSECVPISASKSILDESPSGQISISARKQKTLSTLARTERYLRERRIPELIRFLMTKVIAQASNDPMTFLEKLLDDSMLFRAGHGLAPVLYEKRHIEAIIKSFDPGQRGWLSPAQIRQAFNTMGLTSPEVLEEQTSCEEVLNELEETQQIELFNLLSAGIDTKDLN